jgi:hypothetical protein
VGGVIGLIVLVELALVFGTWAISIKTWLKHAGTGDPFGHHQHGSAG